LGARLNAIFSSDIGHFDVPEMTDVVPETHEMVEDGLAPAIDFRVSTFASGAARGWCAGKGRRLITG
jgi:hypothetical protein